jgi:hypothetical protein
MFYESRQNECYGQKEGQGGRADGDRGSQSERGTPGHKREIKGGVPDEIAGHKEIREVQERHWAQEGRIKGLLDYLFAEQWEMDFASLQDKAHSTHHEEQASLQVACLAASLQQRSAGVPSYRPMAGRGRGGFGGPKRKELVNGGYDYTNYAGAKPTPPNCCRGWWLDGLCNVIDGSTCVFTHLPEHRARGVARAN